MMLQSWFAYKIIGKKHEYHDYPLEIFRRYTWPKNRKCATFTNNY